MKVRAQISMVMNLDKCLGCHTCSITCKTTWTNRRGAEYMWWNNVETRPGVGYPQRWEDQEKWKGGWKLENGELKLRVGGRLSRLFRIFYNPWMPSINDYYEPWSYTYEKLIEAKEGEKPLAEVRSSITQKPLTLERGPNWDDDLAGSPIYASSDPNLEKGITLEYERIFMFYLPRICNHCLNPSCVAACPSGAMYKREEDGIVLVDQSRCRGWRYCISACPYKKVYYNWSTHKAEKCILCYPRIEAGLPPVCAETCVGRMRYVGLLLYDAERIREAASAEESALLEAQLSIILDPNDPKIEEEALNQGIWKDWLEAAKKSPVFKMVKVWKIAFPLHPEYRTLPMVFYIPPLSPILRIFEGEELGKLEPEDIFPNVRNMRIPIAYLAKMFTAGNEDAIRKALEKLIAVRAYMRSISLGRPNLKVLSEVGLSEKDAREMYRLLAVAKYEDRFVIPKAHREQSLKASIEQGYAGLDELR
ncbi:MAG: nitrate reductase subunit beta [Nitrososphaerota archaeon]